MSDDRVRALEALLVETEQAHRAYEATELGGVYDQDWPRWYAAYAVEHGLGGLLGRAVTADEVTQFLASAWDVAQRADPKPGDPWASWMARRMESELAAA